MGKEWDKFSSEYKKLAPKIEKYSAANASQMKTRVNSANTNYGEGERNLADCMVVARKNGVTGDKLEDFQKDKGFAEGYKLLQVAVGLLTEELDALQEFSKAAAVVLKDVTQLEAAIAKDLKARSSLFSSSKKDIAAMQTQLELDIKSLKEAAGKSDAVEQAKKNRAANFTKAITDILKQAPAAQEKKRESEMLPQLLVDRNLKSNLSKAQAWAKSIATEIEGALDDAADDMVKALTRVKGAAVQLKSLADMNADYTKLKTSYKDAIEISKDKSKIETAITALEKMYKASESKVRGAATTLKKAG